MIVAAPAFAQTSGEAATAEALFNEGKKLMDEGSYAEACPKLAESQKLDPGGGTILNLALCHEKEGKTATAWSEFKTALATARDDNNEGRQQFAQQHIDALEPKLTKLVVELAQGAEVAGLQITRDGTDLGSAAWGVALPVDPGEHLVAASAPGYLPWQQTVQTQGEGATVKLLVPLLEPDANAGTAAPEPLPGPTPSPTPPPPADTGEGGSAQATIGWIVGGVGVASAIVGAVFGGLAISADSEADDNCSESVCDNTQGVEASEDARARATLANVFVFGGLGLAAVGVVLVLTAPSDDEPAVSATLAPAFGPDGGGASLRMTW